MYILTIILDVRIINEKRFKRKLPIEYTEKPVFLHPFKRRIAETQVRNGN